MYVQKLVIDQLDFPIPLPNEVNQSIEKAICHHVHVHVLKDKSSGEARNFI